MPPEDQFDTIIQPLIAAPEATRLLPEQQRVRPQHPVLAFEAGAALFLVDAILALLLVWFLRHG